MHKDDQNRLLKDTQEWFSSLDLTNIQILYVFGAGSGEVIEVAKPWLDKSRDHVLVLLEKDRDFSSERLINEEQIFFCRFGDLDIEDNTLKNLMAKFAMRSYLVVPSKKYQKEYSKLFSKLKAKIAYYSHIHSQFASEYIHYGASVFRNVFRNFMYLPSSHFGNALFGKFKGIPAIICGAGPSLGKNISILETLKDRALIFAGGTAMNALNGKGILPHFGLAVDPNLYQFTRQLANQAFEVPYFYRNRLNHEAFREIHGEHLFINGTIGHPIVDWMEEQVGIVDEPIEEGANVINFGLSLAYSLGCDPIIIVGTDLAYTDQHSYAPDVLAHALHDFKSHFQTKTQEEELLQVTDINGKQVYSLWKWIMESMWFSQFAQKHSDLTLINATEGGIGFPNVPNKTLLEVSETLLQKKYDFEGLVHAEMQNSCMPQQVTSENVKRTFEKIGKSMHICLECFKTLQAEALPDCEEKLHQQLAYDLKLKYFEEVFRKMFSHQVDDLRPALYTFLIEAAMVHIMLIDEAINLPFPEGTSGEGKEYQPLPGEEYSFENGVLRMIDPEMGIHINENCMPVEEKEVQYPNGSIRSRQHTFQGELCGPSFFYDEEGKTLSEGWFWKGRGEGKHFKYFSSGGIASIQRYQNGNLDGKQEYYYPNGQIKSILEYSQGKLNGDVWLYHPNGSLFRELHFIDGARQGVERKWSSEKRLLLEVEYEHNLPVRKAHSWYQNGSKAIEITYDAESHPISKQVWDQEGNLIPVEKYQQDDFFDSVTKQTSLLTNSLDILYENLTGIAPGVSQKNEVEGDLSELKNEIQKLHRMKDDLLSETGLAKGRSKEAIWKSPSSKREIEKQLTAATEKMLEDLQGVHDAMKLAENLFKKNKNEK